jgi:hypothetical protein
VLPQSCVTPWLSYLNDRNYATTVTDALAAKAPLNNASMTGTTTINDLKVVVGVSTDSPLGLVLGGVGVSTLGGLTVNGNVISTGNLTVSDDLIVGTTTC